MYLQVSLKPLQALEIAEEQFKKARQSRITSAQITNSKRFASTLSYLGLIPKHPDHIKRGLQAFRKAFKEIQQKITDRVTGEQISRYAYDQEKDEFIRRNQFQQIKDQSTLLQFIKKNPKGVLVTDELLEYTSNTIQKDIENLLKEKKIKKIMANSKTKKDYYVFPNTIQKDYELGDQFNYEYFGKDQYVQLCKKNIKTHDDQNEEQNLFSSSALYNISNQKCNDWVDGYSDLKREWLIKNQEKERQKLKG